MELTNGDRILLDGLRVLTDAEIGRVQAHLAAGLPMKVDFGWQMLNFDEPSCFGCLIGTVMSFHEYHQGRREAVQELALEIFPTWAVDNDPECNWEREAINRKTLRRLAAIVEIEWKRRVGPPANERLATAELAAPEPVKETVGV